MRWATPPALPLLLDITAHSQGSQMGFVSYSFKNARIQHFCLFFLSSLHSASPLFVVHPSQLPFYQALCRDKVRRKHCSDDIPSLVADYRNIFSGLKWSIVSPDIDISLMLCRSQVNWGFYTSVEWALGQGIALPWSCKHQLYGQQEEPDTANATAAKYTPAVSCSPQ